MNECEFHEQCEKCVGALISKKKHTKKRCPQCTLENNHGVCDRKDCCNYYNPDELVRNPDRGIEELEKQATEYLDHMGLDQIEVHEIVEYIKYRFNELLHQQLQKAREEEASNIIAEYMEALGTVQLPQEVWLWIADINGKYLNKSLKENI